MQQEYRSRSPPTQITCQGTHNLILFPLQLDSKPRHPCKADASEGGRDDESREKGIQGAFEG
jgi:hypothetical protein